MKYEKYIKFIKRYSYDRYDNFDNLNGKLKTYPVSTPIDCESVLKLDSEKLKKVNLGSTLPLIQNTMTFNNVTEFLSVVSFYSLAISRCEPQNPYFYHLPVPSAKGIHPCECYFIVNNNGQNICLRFNSASSSFELVNLNIDKDFTYDLLGREMDRFDVVTVIASDIFRLAKFYGSFAYILSAIDTGHIVSQMGIIASRGTKKISTYYDVGIEKISDYLKVNYNEVQIEAVMHFRLEENDKDIDIKQTFKGDRKSFYVEEMMKFKNTVDINELIIEDFKVRNKGTWKSVKYNFNQNNKLVDSSNINNTIYNRTSAQNVLGTFSVSEPIEKIVIEESALSIYEYLSNVGLLGEVNTYFFVNDVIGYKRGWYKLEEGKISKLKHKDMPDMINFVHDSHEYFSISTMPIVVFFSCNVKKYYDKYGVNGIKVLYINTGEVCQASSLSLTKHGYFTRPLKNLNERYVEESLKLKDDERITYMLAVGKSNISSLDLEVQ